MAETDETGDESRQRRPADEGRVDAPSPDKAPTGSAPEDRSFFGHPRGLMTLFTTEMWERFSYYGMRAILLYFITDTIAEGGLGFPEASGEALVAIYGTSVYLLSVVGGWLADRVIGARRSVLYGGIVIAAGHVVLSIPMGRAALIGIALVAIGTGLLKSNVSSMVGDLYDRDDPRRDSGFSIFYMGINLGSFFSPLIVGAVRAAWGYHAGFIVAAIGMGLALVFFVGARSSLKPSSDIVPNPITAADRPALIRLAVYIVGGIAVVTALATLTTSGDEPTDVVINTISYLALIVPILFFVVMLRSPKVTAIERPRVVAYIPLFIASMLFWMIFEQAASTMSSFAKNRTDLSVFGVEISPEFFQSVNPVSIIILAPVFAWIWKRTSNRPPTAYKFTMGLTLAALSFLLLAGASTAIGADGKAPAWVLGLAYVIQTLGELCLSPVGLAATTLLAPKAFRGQAMALWFLSISAGGAITAQLIVLTDKMGLSDAQYFGGIGVAALVGAGLLLLLSPWVTRHIRHADALEAGIADA